MTTTFAKQVHCISCGASQFVGMATIGPNVYECLGCGKRQKYDSGKMVALNVNTGSAPQSPYVTLHPHCPRCGSSVLSHYGNNQYQCCTCMATLIMKNGKLVPGTVPSKLLSTPLTTTFPKHPTCPVCGIPSVVLNSSTRSYPYCVSCGAKLTYDANGNLVLSATAPPSPSAPGSASNSPVAGNTNITCPNCGSMAYKHKSPTGIIYYLCHACNTTGHAHSTYGDPKEDTQKTITLGNGKSYLIDQIGKQLRNVDDLQDVISFRDAPYCVKCNRIMDFYGMLDSRTDYYDCPCGNKKPASRSLRTS